MRKRDKNTTKFIIGILILVILTVVSLYINSSNDVDTLTNPTVDVISSADYENNEDDIQIQESTTSETEEIQDVAETVQSSTEFTLDNLDLSYFDVDNPYIVVNNNEPYFDELTTEVFETYSDFDSLGRCGVAYANICLELMPTDDRESISKVYPSGWKYNNKSNNNKYDTELVDGGYLYNRSHLIGFQLAGENANELNLITGTRFFNVNGMLPFENIVADYIDENPENHVMYRVTPYYQGDNLVASGVLMEAKSVEDCGEGICFNVFIGNIQPGIEINYLTGENWLE